VPRGRIPPMGQSVTLVGQSVTLVEHWSSFSFSLFSKRIIMRVDEVENPFKTDSINALYDNRKPPYSHGVYRWRF
jgi:hypothetical protein